MIRSCLMALLVLSLFACEGEPASTVPEANLIRQSLGQALVISQVYGGGGNQSATFDADFVELHNTSSVAVDLTGFSLQYSAATSTNWSRAALPSSAIAAGGYFLIQVGNVGTVGSAFTPDYVTKRFNLGTAAGKIALVTGTTTLPDGACPTNAAIDFIGYGASANCSESSNAPAPSATASIERTNHGCADTDVNAQDVVISSSNITPRSSKTTPFVCGGTDAGMPTDGVPCGSQGFTCPATSCCDDLGYISFCVDPSDFCFNGAQCNASSKVCEFADGGTTDPGVRSIGSACSTDTDCQNDLGPSSLCKKATAPGNTTYTGGYCTVLCGADGLCPPSSACVNLSLYGESQNICWNLCGNGVQCRNNYACYQDTVSTTRGCWIDPTPPRYDGGVSTGPIDGGVVTPVDAGLPVVVDAGSPVVDAGMPVVDAGSPSHDAGVMVVDAGPVTAVDAGSVGGDTDAGTSLENDAGAADDAGAVDELNDAGSTSDSGSAVRDAGRIITRDAGTHVTPTDPVPAPTGCGCSSTDVGVMLPFALAAVALRRRRGSVG